MYNKDYHLTETIRKCSKNNKAAKQGILFFKVDTSSVMSNEELEMSSSHALPRIQTLGMGVSTHAVQYTFEEQDDHHICRLRGLYAHLTDFKYLEGKRVHRLGSGNM